METIKPGKYVELGYDLYELTPDGAKLVHQTDIDDPEKIIFGVTVGMIQPLERAIEGLSVGDEFNVDVKAADAFGPHDPEQVVTLDRDIFMVDGKFDDEMIKVGEYVPMMTADKYRINGLVTEVTDTNVKMDFNHPLAGKDVRFSGKILIVRDATPDELQPAHSCGGCCSGCGDDNCCGGDNGSGCGDNSCGCGAK